MQASDSSGPTSSVRFDAFTAQKTVAASEADLQPFRTVLDVAPPDLLRLGNAWTRRYFDGDFYGSPAPDAGHPACSLVFVQSLDGNTGTPDPSTLGGGETDKHVVYEGLSQVAADAVLTGAETIRDSAIVFGVWHPELVRLRAALGKPRYPVQIVATLRGIDLDDGLLFNVPTLQVLVLTGSAGADAMRRGFASRPWVRPIVMPRPGDWPAAFDALRSLGVERVAAVGGRHVATQLIDAGLVQDVYLTTAARTGGENGTPMYPRPLQARTLVRKHGTGRDAGVVFEHLVLASPQPAVTVQAPTDRA